jgi:hypothetical protein
MQFHRVPTMATMVRNAEQYYVYGASPIVHLWKYKNKGGWRNSVTENITDAWPDVMAFWITRFEITGTNTNASLDELGLLKKQNHMKHVYFPELQEELQKFFLVKFSVPLGFKVLLILNTV